MKTATPASTRALLPLLALAALLFLALPVSAHYGIFHNFKGGPWLLLWAGWLFLSLVVYEWLGDTPLGHAVLFSGLIGSLYPSVAYPHHELDAFGWQALAFIVMACFAFFLGRAKLSRKQQGRLALAAGALALGLVLFTALAAAHDNPLLFPKKDYTDAAKSLAGKPWYVAALYYVWGLHDEIHWWVILLMLWTCYHFRFVAGKLVFRHPAQCATFLDKRYEGERKLHFFHRYFWAANVVLIGIHWHEVLTGWSFGLDYTYTFQHQVLGMLAELSYVVFFTLWLLSCHFFKYALGAQAACASCPASKRVQASQAAAQANQLHGLFMWLALLSMLLLLAMEGHL